MIEKFKRFIALSSEEKKLFMEAFMMLGMMRAAVLSLSFKRLTRSLEQLENKKKVLEKLDEKEAYTAKSVGKAIKRASAYTPWESACLVQSLTAQKMLKKRGIAGVFYLGVKKDAEDNEIKAHAWSQCGDNIITGSGGHKAFTVLSAFEWK